MSGFADFVRRSPSARFVFAVPIAVRRKWNSHKYTPMLDVLQRMEDLVASDLRVKVAEFEGEFLLGPRSHLLRRVLLTSGLLGEVAMLAVGRPPELRCSLWLIATTVIAAALLLAYRASQARES